MTTSGRPVRRVRPKTVDLAAVHGEHVKGTPYHYKHGWVKITPEMKERKKIRASLKANPIKAQHVVDMWNQANADEKHEGENWYTSAHDLADAMAKKYGVSTKQAAGIIAVYSPQTGWGTNLTRAATVLRTRKAIGGKGSGVMATARQKANAERILAGEDYDNVIKGKKINNFAHLIEHGGDVDGEAPRVVMDRHAIGVSRGISMSEKQYTIDRPSSVKRYEKFSDAYREAAKQISKQEGRFIAAHQVQAATWLTRQRLNKSANRGKARNTRGLNDWKNWVEYASQQGLGNGTGGKAGVGYELSTPHHEPGTPYHYKHGWIRIADFDTRKVQMQKALRLYSDAHSTAEGLKTRRGVGDGIKFTENGIRKNEIERWSRKLYHPRVALAHNKRGEIIGHAVYESERGQVSIHDVRVEPEYRGKGVGDALIGHLKKRAKKGNQSLSVYNALDTAKKFYEKTGANFPNPSSHVGEWDLAQPQGQTIDVSDVSQPPKDDEVVQHVAEILLAGYAASKALALLTKLLVPLGLTAQAIRPAYGLAMSGTKALPNARLAVNGIEAAGTALKRVRYDDIYYRAAYILNAARRIQKSLAEKKPLRVALSQESTFYRQHEQARRGRLDAAARAQAAAKLFGPIIGWYLNPLLNNEAECIAANGHNFYADEGTVIGFPGSVHGKCGCKSGPPHEGAAMVNDVMSNLISLGKKRKYKIKVHKSA